ncbi:Anthranilate synthase component 1 [Sphaceloma murrayae]|uniref:Anthranilate synthase component 1 n=1 Tax=Sphaceloma murrayae TaxID=2082308 RepID=A0A2K1R3F0_9PEZI|nr:Anthranilate synthase component 1 [Sphaceloma murrayae]
MAESLQRLAWHVIRQANEDTATSSEVAPEPSPEAPPACDVGNEYNGRLGLRISAIFVILVGAGLGAWFPVFASRRQGLGVPQWAFFLAKYFGSGVIIATAFIHLLVPANENLLNECLTGPITEYPWVEGIALMTIFVLFFVELMTMRYAKFGHSHDHSHSDAHSHDTERAPAEYSDDERKSSSNKPAANAPHVPGDDHLGHSREHTSTEANNWGMTNVESFSAQLTAVFILEFGIIFHSIFIGLTLAVAGEEFTTLYVVLVFHQTFEGLGLGSRLSMIPWPKQNRWTPYLLGAGYAVSTPIAIAIGLGVRQTFQPGSPTTLIVNGVFDSISAGILLYTGLVELMAHEFMFSPYMARAPIGTVLMAFGFMTSGAGLMALLGKWA